MKIAITKWQNISFGKKVNECQEDAFEKLTQEMRKDIWKSWTSVELHKKYTKLNGWISSRRTIIEKVKEKISDKFSVPSSPGIAYIIIFKEAVSKMLKIEDREDINFLSKRSCQKNSETFQQKLNANTHSLKKSTNV